MFRIKARYLTRWIPKLLEGGRRSKSTSLIATINPKLLQVRHTNSLSIDKSIESESPFIPLLPPIPATKSSNPEISPVFLQETTVCLDSETALTIQEGSDKFEVPLLWLRDSCTCENCMSAGAYQRKNCTIATEAKLIEAQINNGFLHTVWTDGHKSHHKLSEIKQHFQPSQHLVINKIPVEKELWNRQSWEGSSLKPIPHDEVFTDAGLRSLLTNIQRYGFGLVNECEASESATETLIQRIGPPMPTTFSPGMWTFTSNNERGDSAYTNIYLAPHTDTTYFSNPCRLQIFHCLEREGCTGGDNILVDGFAVAKSLKETNIEAFNMLSTIPQECIYIEPGVCYKWTDPVLTHDPEAKDLQRVRFNMYDRSTKPPLCHPSLMDKYYKSVKKFADLTQKEENQYLLRLVPGLVIVIDNWRVLHGRMSFTGPRVLTGCYMSNDEFEHACRKFHLIA